jgi:hypothetical protein
MFAGSIPIYWGNLKVGQDFNSKSFVNVNDFSSWQQAIEKIIELDSDDEKYKAMLDEPWFINNQIPEEFSDDNLLRFFRFMVQDSKLKKPVATSWINDTTHRLVLYKNRIKGSLYHRLGIEKGFR